jgi:hypothetical protein
VRIAAGAIVGAVIATASSNLAWSQTAAAKPEVTVTKAPGGLIQTRLSGNIIVNKESTVTREWLALHDPAMPADLIGTPGVTTVFVPDRLRGEYQYQAKVPLQAKKALAAVEVRFLVFDVWGQHVRTLLADEITDIPAGSTKELVPEWRLYSESECSKHYASIAYISRIRTADGIVLDADPAPVVREAQKFSKKFTAADLEPKAEPK